jgi:hypothetical protein
VGGCTTARKNCSRLGTDPFTPPLVDQLAVVRLGFCCNVKPGENNFKQVIKAACGKI